MNEFTWKTNVLGNKGNLYYALPTSGVVLLVVTTGVLIYSLILDPALPNPIKTILFLCGGFFLYQAYQVFTLFIYARNTAKQITLKSNGEIILDLFSNKTVSLKKFSISKGVSASVSKIFPENSNATITTNNVSHYISGTTDDFSDLYKKLEALSNS